MTSDTATTPTLEEFTAEARAFLSANAEPAPARTEFVWGEGDDFVGIVEEGDPDEELAQVAAAREWAAKRFDAGFGWIDGPVDLGGRGLGTEYVRAYRSLEAGYQLPDQSIFTIGLVMFAAIGTFVRLKYTYDATMERLEAERREARQAASTPKPAHRDAA